MFTPFILNGQTIKNRIVRSATREYLFHPDGTVTDEFLKNTFHTE
jgi:2,4-dienoyl-CoA reductase-like NADH-dependent reductase (Old Yellow Enzyme family)